MTTQLHVMFQSSHLIIAMTKNKARTHSKFSHIILPQKKKKEKKEKGKLELETKIFFFLDLGFIYIMNFLCIFFNSIFFFLIRV